MSNFYFMNYFSSTRYNATAVDVILFIVRVFIGFAMLTHGYPKLVKLVSGEEIQFYNFLGMGGKLSLGLAVFAEFVCSIFLILGLFTRWAASFLAFTMVIAAFVVHSADAFDAREMSLIYLSIYALILVLGPGKYSVDHKISSKNEVRW